MYSPLQQLVGGFGPRPSTALPMRQFSRPFASVEQATLALTPNLFRAANELHVIYGTAPAVILANLLAVVAFAAAGNCRICDHRGNPMSLALHVDCVGLPLNGKSDAYKYFMRSTREAMQVWPHEWRFANTNQSTLLRRIRKGATYGFLAMDEGLSYLNSQLSRNFDLLTSLYEGDVPPFARSDEAYKAGEKVPESIVFGTCVNAQPVFYASWLDKHKKDALGSGYLYRKLIFRSDDKAQPGTSLQTEVALSVFDLRIIEMVTAAVQKLTSMEPSELPPLSVSSEAEQILSQAIHAYRCYAEAYLPPRDAEVFAVRLAANVRRIAGGMHLFENYLGAVSADTMGRAVTIGEFATVCWFEMVFPITLPPQEVTDAYRLEHHLQSNYGSLTKTDLLDTAVNFDWTKPRMERAIQALCGSGRALSIPRIKRGRRCVMIELQGVYPLLGNI